MKVSVIATVFNEATTIGPLLASLLDQTHPADEIVIADAGSTDGTRHILAGLATEGSVRVIDVHGNRSTGRNAAIRASSGDVIACIDGGCIAHPTWLEHLVEPFTTDGDFVGGFYRPRGRTALSTCIGLVMVYVRSEAEHEGFLPSARSVAFRRHVWSEVGGFPEDVEYAEDTLFAQRIVDAGVPLVPALDAIVDWEPPASLASLAATARKWGHGDGLAGLRGFVFKRLVLVYLGAAALLMTGLVTWRPLAWVGTVLLGLDTVRRTRPKYRDAPKPVGYLYVPIAHLTATYSSIVGFLAGRRSRLRSQTSRSV